MKSTLSILTLATAASAHYTFSKIAVNGELQGGDWTYIREHTRGYMPTKGQEILENDFRCQPGGDSGANTDVLTVSAGDKIDFQGAFGMTSIEHPGPAQVYFSKAPGDDVKSYAGDGDWFKVREALLCSQPSADGDLLTDAWCTWGQDGIDFEIPVNIPSGQYLVRVEHIPLHGAQGSPDGAEYYYSCGQLDVTGSSGEIPAEVGRIPGMIQPDDEAVIFNIWTGATSYDPASYPGAPLIEGGTQWGTPDGASDAVTGGEDVAASASSASGDVSVESGDDESSTPEGSYDAPDAAVSTSAAAPAPSSAAPVSSAAPSDSYEPSASGFATSPAAPTPSSAPSSSHETPESSGAPSDGAKSLGGDPWSWSGDAASDSNGTNPYWAGSWGRWGSPAVRARHVVRSS